MSIGYSARENPDRTLRQVLIEADNYMYREKLHSRSRARSAIVQSLLTTLSKRDLIAKDRADRIQALVLEWSRVWGLSQQTVSALNLLAQFHDIGKVGIPDEIIFKPGPLTIDETAIMQRHCEIGYQIAMASPDLATIADFHTQAP
jgi:response regulator RpfG family c-di-GMP phosphodiesterase